MSVDTKTISALRAETGAGIVDCKKALEAAGGDLAKAAEELRKKGAAKAEKRGARATKAGQVYAYIHGGGQVGALVEVQTETDFVARNEQFQAFVHDVAMQVAAMNPLYVSPSEIPPEMVAKEKEILMAEFDGAGKLQEMIDKIAEGKLGKFYSEVCLLNQAFIKDEDKTVGDMLTELIAKTGENAKIVRFARFSLADSVPATSDDDCCGGGCGGNC
jgi:elongation factor Ts